MRSIAFRTFHALRPGDDLLHAWREAEELQWADPTDLRARQVKRLAALVADARAHVPHYRGLFAGVADRDLPEVVGSEGWSTVPVLNKATIRAGGGTMRSTAPGIIALPNATSGSTGESLEFFLDSASSAARAASTHRFHRWADIEPWDRHARLWGARFDAPHVGIRQRLTDFLQPQLFLSSYDMSDETIRDYARQLVAFGPRALTSYPSPLEHFAREWTDLGMSLSGLRAIICSAEQLHDHQRELFESTFSCRVFNRYGSREFANVAQECDHHDGLHVAVDRLHVELLRPDGSPVAEGEPGEIVITDPDNRAMPFIRYRTGDLAQWMPGRCGCGRALPRLAGIEGRVMELVRAPGGVVISGTFWPQIVKQSSPRVRFYQIVQHEIDQILIRLVTEPSGPLSEPELASLLGRIRDRSPGLRVEIEYVDDIPLAGAGKRRTVVSHLERGEAP